MSIIRFNAIRAKIITSSIVITAAFLICPLGQKIASAEENWVEVEKSPLVITDDGKTKKISFLDYIDRRQEWNFRFTFLGVQPDLTNYTISSTESISKLGSSGTGFEGLVSISYNFGVFSAGLDVGLMTASFQRDVKVLQPKASLHLMADAFFKNPYAVPYVKFGASQMTFSNPGTSDVPELKSAMATYYALGGMFSLDWFQKSLAMDAFFGYGLDTTYLVVEYEAFSSIPLEIDLLPDIKQSGMKIGLQLVF